MNNTFDLLPIIVRVIFVVIIPSFVVYLRYKKTLTTPFSAGIIITSLIFSLILVSTVKEDPAEKLIKLVNQNRYEDAKKLYKIVLQYGSQYSSKIDEKKIILPDLFLKIRKETAEEYQVIVEKYIEKYPIINNFKCSGIEKAKEKITLLKHADTLMSYSILTGEHNKNLGKKLSAIIADGIATLLKVEKNCKEN